ncbi:DUF378 domain-containing protein [Candidatus Kaiserbacteria bacterium CG10_big_fil_rev_8_21_14_0_10_49_17]|uniref:DUF378 domain-containing protein n=1 Tax=Candidatus Kaiserbacteria bacterium CG10_big_fil_rev_8_21_14_0_10_49_17 TaxID=1974609 RepID=A0A2M6WFB2_9BACT|nr:MAG: DUF378 domain-containing protein [Candidatus Kaiserbacteria bacterium CG10_big_fil_rev_8_21_14_0_10_49_17]
MVNKVAWILVVIGALNWLLFGLTGSDVGSYVGGMDGIVAKIIYILVGVSGLWLIASKFMGKGKGGPSNSDAGMAAPMQ